MAINKKNLLKLLFHSLMVSILLYFMIPVLILDPLDKIASLKSADKSTELEMSDIYHIVYANREPPVYYPSIKLVYVDDCINREEIADIINRINDSEPLVIGLDLMFNTPFDARQDSILIGAISNSKKIVNSCILSGTDDGISFDNKKSYFFRETLQTPEGFINLEGSGGQSIIRNFKPQLYYNTTFRSDTIYSFASEIIHTADSLKFEKLLRKSTEPELINYKLLYFDEYMSKDFDSYKGEIKDNIILIGSYEGDWHNTPINPQMNGMAIHAYTIATILSGESITKVYNLEIKIISFIITYLISLFCIMLMKRMSSGSSAIIRIIQFGVLAALLYIGYMLFIKCNINIYFTQILLAVSFASLATDVYLGFLVLAGKVKTKILNMNFFNKIKSKV